METGDSFRGVTGMEPFTQHALAATAVLFIGLSKAGFGGGLGMLTTPLCVLAFSSPEQGRGPTFAIGALLPLLCAGDAFSMRHFWGRWQSHTLKQLLPGILLGVVIGVHCLDRFSARQLNVIIGMLALLFVLFQLGKEHLFKHTAPSNPGGIAGLVYGLGAGVTSTFAHGAGPVINMFLIPQRLPKETYMGTTILVFTWINWIKMPFFVWKGIITRESLMTGALYLALVPLGVRLGVWLNRRIPEKAFLRWVYGLTFAAGLQLITGFNPAKALSSFVGQDHAPVPRLNR